MKEWFKIVGTGILAVVLAVTCVYLFVVLPMSECMRDHSFFYCSALLGR